ncbi:MAG: hypothetical protein J6Q39_07640 [Bacteroidales bacterium]|nr:hypothetical protein [Bacteroidales bacterium]
MTQQEFQERVKMPISAEEFEAVNHVYMLSDLNKDDFCKMWVQMNKSRVQQAAKEAKANKEEADNKERARRIFDKLEAFINKDFENYINYAHLFLGARDRKFLKDKLSIEVDCMSNGSLRFRLGQFIGIY